MNSPTLSGRDLGKRKHILPPGPQFSPRSPSLHVAQAQLPEPGKPMKIPLETREGVPSCLEEQSFSTLALIGCAVCPNSLFTADFPGPPLPPLLPSPPPAASAHLCLTPLQKAARLRQFRILTSGSLIFLIGIICVSHFTPFILVTQMTFLWVYPP